ncbi:MAG: acylphosphatase [Alphaproteobacteria bacterium]
MPDDAPHAVRVTIGGRVQGVGYRAWTVNTAGEFDLSGWVRNRHDGSVEALFAGPASRVEAMIARCRQGPPAARVDDLAREPADWPSEPGFRQLPTA